MATQELKNITLTPDQAVDQAFYRAYVESGFDETGIDMPGVRRHQRWMAEHSIDATAGDKFDERLARFTAPPQQPAQEQPQPPQEPQPQSQTAQD